MRAKQRCEVRPRFIGFLSRKSPDIGGVLFLYLDPDLGLKSEYSRNYILEKKVMVHNLWTISYGIIGKPPLKNFT